MTAAETKHSFQAEVGRLLHLMVHSVYTDKEIFLRELISNASDACDKLRYEAIGNAALLGPDERLAISIKPELETGVLVISDNGIGMDASELTDNLGTIARSGTRAFLDKLKEAQDANAEGKGAALIGQFGVGFYSAFMVADHIDVISRKVGSSEGHVWHSDGESGFTVTAATPEQLDALPRGTQIRLTLKSDCRQFLEDDTIERIVRTYSDHILFPVELVPAEGETHQINTAGALWQRSKSEVTPEQYKEVYQTVSGSYDAPRLTIHYKTEGRQSYAVLLFVPERKPFDLYDPSRKGRVKLYVRRVFITDDAGLLPSYLRFVRGVVDSEDVPLNISREMLQNNPLVSQIRKAVTTRVLSEMESFATKDAEGFEALWDAFGSVIKEGLYEDFERREQLLGLARFRSSTGEGWRSIGQYVESLRENQTEIYYLTGDSLERLKASPQLEAARARGVEVLLMTDPIDAFWVAAGADYKGKPFKSLTQGDVDLSLIPLVDSATPPPVDAGGDAAALAVKFKEALGADVSDVRVSKRLVTSAVCLVAPGGGPDLSLDKLLARQDRGFGTKPVLEINAEHPLIAALTKREGADVGDVARLLFDQAKILDGETLPDAARFAEIMNKLMLRGI
ncbi:MAG: molecular chaperone HtpG [Hyphomicrobiaceae bacterium]